MPPSRIRAPRVDSRMAARPNASQKRACMGATAAAVFGPWLSLAVHSPGASGRQLQSARPDNLNPLKTQLCEGIDSEELPTAKRPNFAAAPAVRCCLSVTKRPPQRIFSKNPLPARRRAFAGNGSSCRQGRKQLKQQAEESQFSTGRTSGSATVVPQHALT
jgi:hypothetical protein